MNVTTIELSDLSRNDALASLQRYFRDELQEELGTLPASNLLNYILEEIGPAIYNRAVLDAQSRIQARAAELDAELYLDPFQYWPRLEKRRRTKHS